jgi:hypothetical protein
MVEHGELKTKLVCAVLWGTDTLAAMLAFMQMPNYVFPVKNYCRLELVIRVNR